VIGVGGAEEPGSLLLLQAKAVALDEQDVTVVEHAVEHGRCDHLVAEDVTPLRDGLVGGEEQAAALVAPPDQLEEQVRGLLLQGQVAELVDDERLGFGVEGDLVGELSSCWALESAARSEVAVTNKAEWPASTAARPKAIARCVLPTPGGPKSRTFSAPAMKRPVASSRTSLASRDGWNLKSNPRES
jgi:hypothetical protein